MRSWKSAARRSPFSPGKSSTPGKGYTLVELLIVVGLLLLLTTMTVVAVDFTFQSERVRAGARQIQSLLEGARDRAIFAREPRGVRFLLEPDELNGRKVASMIYIGASDDWNQGTIQLERLDDDGDGTADSPDVLIVRGDSETLWSTLSLRGYLGTFEDTNLNGQLDSGEDRNLNGQLDLDAPQIKIPGDRNGNWYSVLTHRLAPGNEVLQLISPFRDPGTTDESEVHAFEGSGPRTYLLRLPPRILPDAEIVQLPAGAVIDLDGSVVPVGWRPPSGTGYEHPYASRLDVMFSPRGTVMNATGLMHLYVTLRADVDLATRSDFGDRRSPVNQASGLLTRTDGFNRSKSVLLADHPTLPSDAVVEGDRSLVTVYTNTGKVTAVKLDLTDGPPSGTGDGWADDPFRFAVKGEGAN